LGHITRPNRIMFPFFSLISLLFFSPLLSVTSSFPILSLFSTKCCFSLHSAKSLFSLLLTLPFIFNFNCFICAYLRFNDTRMIDIPSFTNEYLFLNFLWIIFLLNCHDLSNSKCSACIGTISHKTSSIYLPTKK